MAAPDDAGLQALYETARALGEETRFRIYRSLWESDAPLGVTELADGLPLHPNAVRQHLARLERAGLVSSVAERPAGAGRPRRLYAATPPPSMLRSPRATDLVDLLTAALEVGGADRARLVAVGRQWARRWATEPGSSEEPVGTARLATELAAWGWLPDTRATSEGVEIVTRRCLFGSREAGDHGPACAVEEGLLRGLSEATLGATEPAVSLSVRGCRLEARSAAPPAPAQAPRSAPTR